MKTFTITSAKFSEIGNITASNILGKKIFVHRNLLESAGITATNITFPMFAVWDTIPMGQLDPKTRVPLLNPDGTQLKILRDEATGIFLTKAVITQAIIDDDSLDRDIANALREASTAGLNQTSINALAELV